MSDQTLARARAGDEHAFRELTEPYRRELQMHVYRIVGSAQDAEDLVQDTLLAAWRGLGQFQRRASVRAWLYRIATNRSLDALRASRRRPQGLQRMTDVPEPTRRAEPVWLEPFPDVLLEDIPDQAPVEAGDVDGMIALLTDDAWLTMPPEPHEYQGRTAIGLFLRGREVSRGRLRLVPTRANGQPAFACYLPSAQTDIARPYSLFVLTLQGDQISAITWFAGSSVFPQFGLPRSLR